MLKLRILDGRPDLSLPQVDDDPGVYVWRDPAGRPCAYGHTVGGHHWMHWPALASYRFDDHADEVLAYPAGSSSSTIITDTFHRMVLPLALQRRGLEALHASGVIIGGRVVVLCAVSGTGKSTLAYALSRLEGHRQWSDDAVVFDARTMRAVELPFDARLMPDAAACLSGFRLPASGFRPEAGFRLSASGFRPEAGFRLPALGFRPEAGFRLPALGFRPDSFWGAGCETSATVTERVSGFRLPASGFRPETARDVGGETSATATLHDSASVRVASGFRPETARDVGGETSATAALHDSASVRVASGFSRKKTSASPAVEDFRLKAEATPAEATPKAEATPDGGEQRSLGAVCVLGRLSSGDDGPDVVVTPLAGSRALAAVLEHAHCFNLTDPARKKLMLEHYLDLVERVPIYEVRFRPGFARLPEVVAELTRTFASRA